MDSTAAVRGIELDDLRAAYHHRGIDGWSDDHLVSSVAAVVAEPRRDPADSFVLHAPLELAARAALLPLVRPSARERARLQILAIAAQYEAFGPPADVPPASGQPAGPGAEEPMRATARLLDAVTSGDVDGAGSAALAVSTLTGREELVRALGDAVVPLTAAAAHAPIFFFHLLRGSRRGPVGAQLLVPLARELAREPGWRITWIDAHEPDRATDPSALASAVTSTPLVGIDGPAFIHPLMMNVDTSGIAAAQLAGVTGAFDPEAGRVLLRVAARSMLEDTADHAPYGWTHCLTIPQAVLGVAGLLSRPDRALAIAATQVAAFRAALGAVDLPERGPAFDELAPGDVEGLASDAAMAHDAHVAKYVLACIDAAALDPDAARLHLAAGRRLLDVWNAMGGDPTDPLGVPAAVS